MCHSVLKVEDELFERTKASLKQIPEFNELDDVAFEHLLEGAIIIQSGNNSIELDEARQEVFQTHSHFLSLILSGRELFIPTVMLKGTLAYCAPGFTKKDGITLLEMRSPYFAIDHFTPIKQYPDDYVVYIHPHSSILILDPETFEKIASSYVGLYRYGIKDRTRLTTAMALSYSALMAPTALLRVARWLRFSAGQRVTQGLPPVITDNSQETIARFLGISRTTLAGAIRVLREDGAIDTRYRKIKVDIEKLTATIERIISESPEHDLLV